MGGDKKNQYWVVRAQHSEPRSVFILLAGRKRQSLLVSPIKKNESVSDRNLNRLRQRSDSVELSGIEHDPTNGRERPKNIRNP